MFPNIAELASIGEKISHFVSDAERKINLLLDFAESVRRDIDEFKQIRDEMRGHVTGIASQIQSMRAETDISLRQIRASAGIEVPPLESFEEMMKTKETE